MQQGEAHGMCGWFRTHIKSVWRRTRRRAFKLIVHSAKTTDELGPVRDIRVSQTGRRRKCSNSTFKAKLLGRPWPARRGPLRSGGGLAQAFQDTMRDQEFPAERRRPISTSILHA